MASPFLTPSLPRQFRCACLLASLVTAAAAVHAEPFRITYTGTAASVGGQGSDLPGSANNPFTVSVVLDNGGTSVNSQTWTAKDVRCVIWRFRADYATVFEQNTSVMPVKLVQGRIVTNSTGLPIEMFSQFAQNDQMLTGDKYTLMTGNAPDSAWDNDTYATWFLPNIAGANGHPGYQGVFYIGLQGFDNSTGSIPVGTDTVGWSTPKPHTGTQCAGKPMPPVAPPQPTSGAQPVPGLGLPALGLLGVFAAGLGARRLRTRRA